MHPEGRQPSPEKRQEYRETMKNRSEIEARYQWKLTDLFPSDEAWEQTFREVQQLAAAFPAHEGKLAESADELFAALTDESKLSLGLEKLYGYAHMKRDEDNGNTQYQAMTDRAAQLYALAGAGSAFMMPELQSIPRETLTAWSGEERFAPFRFLLSDVERQRPHILSGPEERLMALASEPLSGPDNIFTMLSDVDLSFGTVRDGEGNEVELTHGTYGLLLENKDRRVRRDAYEGIYRAYRRMGNTIAATYASSVKGDGFQASARGFDSALGQALFAHNVPGAVYDQLIHAVHEKLPALSKYIKLRQEKLGLDTLEMYDLYVPIVPDVDIPVPYEEARELVLAAVKPLGAAYGKLLSGAFENGWIDVYETRGKTSGAFSNGVYGTHPYVLLNYQDRMDDAFTLAHELGHAMHSYLSDTAQPYETAQYSIMAAEVASTVNENLLTRYLLGREKDPMRRAYYINHLLEQFRTTCFRQTMFAEFEKKAHDMAENGEALTVESLSAAYRALNELYYPDVHVDDNIACEWMRIPHFYNAFYVYQYATGICSAVRLAGDVLETGSPERYLTFLKSGGSDYPVELLKKAGVDLTREESILSALDVFEQYVEELTALL